MPKLPAFKGIPGDINRKDKTARDTPATTKNDNATRPPYESDDFNDGIKGLKNINWDPGKGKDSKSFNLDPADKGTGRG